MRHRCSAISGTASSAYGILAACQWSIVRKIMLPGALPSVLAGFRITISVAIILLVAAEMIGADSGIGAFILSAGNLYRTDDLIAGVVILSLIGLVLSAILTRVERAAFTWR
jgi:ABC-type nitrate/sulfonate/bicarbonate transport system permease component